ncbi:sugar ABC transporter permease [Novibacillus thermophilus]|uniref:Sugar ABC transporter permease n=2 Tax=Novibacillus thermophilus TaxID=1471761 RepID=A0A1U9K6W6_9BACL|nr:sugar ABC transporter permease [Novibacillus thermophilus]
MILALKRSLMKRGLKINVSGWLFTAPMLIGLTIFMFGPLLYAFYMSFLEWPLLGEKTFTGFGNYERLMSDDKFLTSLKNTFIFSAGLVPLNLALALGLALLLKDHLFGIGLFRTVIFIPVMTSLIVWSIVWKYMLAPELGFINQLLAAFNIKGPAWLLNQSTAMPAIIVTSAIKNVGLNMILFLTALQQVPKSLYEAAELDGAKSIRRFFKITLPLISPTIFLTMIITTIGAMKVFGQVYVMTRGGPGDSTKVLVYYIWETAFNHFEMGYAAAVAFVLFSILIAFTLLSWHFRKRWVFYEN